MPQVKTITATIGTVYDEFGKAVPLANLTGRVIRRTFRVGNKIMFKLRGTPDYGILAFPTAEAYTAAISQTFVPSKAGTP